MTGESTVAEFPGQLVISVAKSLEICHTHCGHSPDSWLRVSGLCLECNTTTKSDSLDASDIFICISIWHIRFSTIMNSIETFSFLQVTVFIFAMIHKTGTNSGWNSQNVSNEPEICLKPLMSFLPPIPTEAASCLIIVVLLATAPTV